MHGHGRSSGSGWLVPSSFESFSADSSGHVHLAALDSLMIYLTAVNQQRCFAFFFLTMEGASSGVYIISRDAQSSQAKNPVQVNAKDAKCAGILSSIHRPTAGNT
jgi:hypothetical protein